MGVAREREPLRDGEAELRWWGSVGAMPVPRRVYYVCAGPPHCVVARAARRAGGFSGGDLSPSLDLPETIELKGVRLRWTAARSGATIEGTYAWEATERTLVVFGELRQGWGPLLLGTLGQS